METWWAAMTPLAKGFALAALFFTVLFAWQIVSMLLGFEMHGADTDTGHGGFGGEMDHDLSDHGDGPGQVGHQLGGEVTFSLVSLRSVLAFFMLFTWAETLYLMAGTSAIPAMALSALWGLAAMFGVSYLIYKLLQLQEIGNVSIWTAMGEEGVVYMDVPADGAGKIRVKVGGVVSFIEARSGTESPLAAGTKIRVSRIIDSRTVEVVPSDYGQGG